MVGVPGKSKGCTTCRRRKIKCDQGRPGCDKCKRSKLECEGYERFPVFINRTESGLQKRKALEEAKVFTPFKKTKVTNDAVALTEKPVVFVPDKPSILNIFSPATEAYRLNGWFFETFFRTSASSTFVVRSPTHWLNYVMQVPVPTAPLKDALLAVSLTKLGETNNVEAIRVESRRMYTRALVQLQRALNSSDSALHDDTLATTAMMILYELYDSSSSGHQGYMGHLMGLARLLEHRGPQRHTSHRSRAVLEHCRHLLMMRGLFFREASFLASTPWLTGPWEDCPKSIEQRVFDHGFIVSSLFERYDKLSSSPPLPTSATEAFNILKECSQFQESIRALHDEVQDLKLTGRVFDPENEKETDETTLMISHIAGPVESEFAELLLAITALAIQLGFCATGWDAYSFLVETGSYYDPESAHAIAKTLAEPLSVKRNVIARRIVKLVALYISCRTGKIGVARLIFALRQAREQLRPDDIELAQCDELLEGMGGQRWRLGVLQKISGGIKAWDDARK